MTIPAGTLAPADLARPAEPSDTADSAAASLYEAIGGHAALVGAVDGLFGPLLADPELAPFVPSGVGERHRRFLVTARSPAVVTA